MLWSALVGGFLAWLIHPKSRVVSVVARGLQFASFGAFLGTITTFHRVVATGFGINKVAEWLVVSISSALAAFIVGCAVQFAIISARKIRNDGPEMLGTAIAKTTEVAQRVHKEAAITTERVQAAVKASKSNQSPRTNTGCFKCNFANELSAKFCAECGHDLMSSQNCRGCGKSLATGQKFCGTCGQQCGI